MSAKLYEQAQAQAQAQGNTEASGQTTAEEDVVDAEFTEENDDK